MGNAVALLDAYRSQRELVPAGSSLWPAVVQETLRRRPSVSGALTVEPGHETAFGRVPDAPSRLELPAAWGR